jgi:hypothetical protein
MRSFLISLVVILFSLVAATAHADDPQKDKSKYDGYIKITPVRAEHSEYVNVVAPPYPGLEMEVLKPEDAWMKKPNEPWKESITDLTADVTHESTRHGNGFYSPRGYTSGQIATVPVVKK